MVAFGPQLEMFGIFGMGWDGGLFDRNPRTNDILLLIEFGRVVLRTDCVGAVQEHFYSFVLGLLATHRILSPSAVHHNKI
jgi:hypothetical protein